MRYVFAILGVLVVVGALVGLKVSQISLLIHNGAAAQKAGPPPEVVASATAQEQTWESSLAAIGTVSASKGVLVSNDAAGVVSRINFESGATVREGQILVELDSAVERSQLASAEARSQLAEINAGRSRMLLKTDAVPRSTLDNDEAVQKTSVADSAALRAQISRKVVRAPFSGRLGIRLINLGQYLNSGTSIAELDALDSVFVDFTLPQERLAAVKLGMPVRVTLEGDDTLVRTGTIAALSPEVDSLTRAVKFRATIDNKDEKLRPGMFVRAAVILPEQDKVVAVPATSVVRAAYGDSVFVIEDRTADSLGAATTPDGRPIRVARQQFVRLGGARGDFLAVAAGLSPGDQIVSVGAFKLRNNSGVVIDNSVQPSPSLDPKPANR
jgi:membrane fusion protein (multidrug efflux system)